MSTGQVICTDCLEWCREQPDDSVDLVFGSPPYEAARTYGIDFKLKGQDWVDWMVERWREWQRISRGLVAMVVEGQTRGRRYSAVPALLMADLHRADFHLRKPPSYRRQGVPGSGGNDWLRNDWEWVVCTAKPGRLAWSDNTAMGHPPKYETGGACSNRTTDGQRINGKASERLKERYGWIDKSRKPNGDRRAKVYAHPEIANPGNVIDCGAVGGGNMGHELCHENEAPFPEYLAEFMIRSFCPPGGVVLDPFSGSGTTAAVAQMTGRRFVAIDIRESQCELTRKRLAVSKYQQQELIG